MTWQPFIESNPEVLAGKPVVRGTRLGVEFLLSLFAEGWSAEQVMQNYPQLTPDALRAVFAFAAEALQDEMFYPADLGAS